MELRRSEVGQPQGRVRAGSDGSRCLPGARPAASPHDRSEPIFPHAARAASCKRSGNWGSFPAPNCRCRKTTAPQFGFIGRAVQAPAVFSMSELQRLLRGAGAPRLRTRSASQPADDGCGECDRREEGLRASVVPRCNAPPVLEPTEHDLASLPGRASRHVMSREGRLRRLYRRLSYRMGVFRIFRPGMQGRIFLSCKASLNQSAS